jgi:hypothetical protein
VYWSESRGRCPSAPSLFAVKRTYREGTLSFDGDHQNTFPIRDNLLADLGCFRTEVGTSNDTKLDLTIDNECEADCELLVSDES